MKGQKLECFLVTEEYKCRVKGHDAAETSQGETSNYRQVAARRHKAGSRKGGATNQKQ